MDVLYLENTIPCNFIDDDFFIQNNFHIDSN